MDRQTTTMTADSASASAYTATTGIGGGKFVGIGIFCFLFLGLTLFYPFFTIVSATDWFEYAMPQSNNISGGLANANFIAQVVRSSTHINIIALLLLI